MRQQATLRGQHLVHGYGQGEMRTMALRDISLEVCRGQVVLLMGPSGSGKSTLLAVLSGLLQPDSGEVLALGKNIWQMSEKEREDFRLQYCGPFLIEILIGIIAVINYQV